MAIGRTGVIEPKNNTFTGIVQAKEVLGGGGDGTLPAATIASDTITYDKMQDVSAVDKVLGRAAGGGDVVEIPCTAAGRALIDDADAAAQRTTLDVFNQATVIALAVAL